jgi:hypothetical protein
MAAEIGPHGVRFTASIDTSLVARRSLDLIHRLYFDSGFLVPEDLAYLLGSPDIGEGELLDCAVQQLPPEEILRQFVVGNRRAALEASEYLGIERAATIPRDELYDRLLWKLGVAPEVVFKDLERVASYEEALKRYDAGGAGPDVGRGQISNLFAALEDSLQRSLEFSTWSLTADHYLADQGFLYDPEPNPKTLDFIESNSPSKNAELTLRDDGKNSLVALAAGFSRLANALRNMEESAHARRIQQFPHEARPTRRPFAFLSTATFFNLSGPSRETVLADLQSVGRHAQDPTVVRVRNASIHGNNEFPSSGDIATAVENVRLCRERLRTSGLYPRVYRLVSRFSDAVGRVTSTYRSGNDDVVFYTPQWSLAPRLPRYSAQLVIVPVANTLSSGPLRFALKPQPGGDPYWDGWPKRWRVAREFSDPGQREYGSVPLPSSPEEMGPAVAG